jgi:outer membrane protein OmpA-like peptidoglycan-associated protein
MSALYPLPRWRLAVALGAALLVGACATSGGSPSSPSGGIFSSPLPGAPGTDPGAAPRAPGTPAPTPLAMEQRFLEDWFRGTPVVISSQPPTTLQLDVPMANSFDAGKADIKPALNAVLDRVAQSLLRHPGARITVSAGPDAGGPAALAQARTQRVRDSLGSKGIAATRVSLIESAPGGAPVQLRLAMPPVSSQPVARRSDGRRTVSAGGVQTISTQRPMWTERKTP